MNLYPNAIPDLRTRVMLPVKRVMTSDKCTGTDSLPDNRTTQVYPWSKEKQSLSIAPGGWILIDFGIELSGGVTMLCMSSGKIRLRFGESASEAMHNPNQDHGIHDTQLTLPLMGCFEYGSTAFRFVRIDSLETEKPLVFQNILASACYMNIEWTGSFCSSDERLNQIWKTSVYTVLLNMQQYICDGCKRDRLPWLGDLNPELRTILVAFSDTSLIRKTLDFSRFQTPHGSWINDMPSYSIWFVICHWEYYMHTGDLHYLELQKEYIRDILMECASFVDANGEEAIRGQRFFDWSCYDDPQATHAGLQGILYWGFRTGQAIFRALGEERNFCDPLVERMKRCIPDCGNSKAAAAIQTAGGLADRSQLLLQEPLKGMTAFLGCYVLDALPTEASLEIIRQYWGGMLDYGATTFWEEFDLDWLKDASPISELPVKGRKDLHADFGDHCYQGYRRSLCHGWASGPASFLSWRIPGIHFLEPGGKRIAVAPSPCGPDFVKGTLPTTYGPISYELENHRLSKLSVPKEIKVEQV